MAPKKVSGDKQARRPSTRPRQELLAAASSGAIASDERRRGRASCRRHTLAPAPRRCPPSSLCQLPINTLSRVSPAFPFYSPQPQAAASGSAKPKVAKPALAKKPADPKKPAAAAAKTPAAAAAAKRPAAAAAPKPKAASPAATKPSAGAGAGSSGSKKMAVGSKMPGFSVVTHDDKPVTSADLLARCEKGIVIFSYPRANTPGCTAQACGFRDNHAEYKALGFDVYGISADGPTPQSNWRAKQGFPYDLLCDKPRAALKALGIDKGGVSVHRSHFVVAKDGTVLQSLVGISPKESIAEALVAAKAAAAAAGK